MTAPVVEAFLEHVGTGRIDRVRADLACRCRHDGGRGHYDLVRWLLDRGANVNARTEASSRHTALHSAAWNGDLEMARVLVNAGADLAAHDATYDGTPRGWASTAMEVTNNPACAEVAAYLAGLEGPP